MTYLPERTTRYKTYVKHALVEALKPVFEKHKDELQQHTRVTIDYPRKEAHYPTVVIRFFEREIKNAGVGHEEWIVGVEDDGSTLAPGEAYRFKHYFYSGDIEFAVHALSSLDRDLISDSLVQTIAFGNLEGYTNQFFNRIYPNEAHHQIPDSIWHYININADLLQGFGENQVPTPWMSEDDLVYLTSYRVRVFGEFYSVPPDAPAEFIEKVIQYPYIARVDPVPTGNPDDDAPWLPPMNLGN